MKKRTKKKTGILLLAAVLRWNCSYDQGYHKDRGQTKDPHTVAEAERTGRSNRCQLKVRRCLSYICRCGGSGRPPASE